MPKIAQISAALAALTALGGSALAQTTPMPPPAHPGLLHNLFHRPTTMHPMPGHMMPGHMMPGHMMMPGRPGMMGGMHSMMGNVIGNKNTHVFHLPGDTGALPAAQNRVYFQSAQQAMAAGYHRAGGGRMPMRGGPMMHGSPMHGMTMHGMHMPAIKSH